MTLASFLIVWGSSQIMVTKKDYYFSKTLQVSPNGYSYQRISFFPPSWDIHFSFTVEEDNIKCVLLDAYDFVVWYLKGQLSHEWIELSSDFSYWKTFMSGLYKKLPASMNPKLAFVVFGSSYISVLIASYLLTVPYRFFAPYGLFLIPLVANFYIGYFVGDLYTAIKIIIVGSSLQAGTLFALLFFSFTYNPFLIVACIYAAVLGIAASFVGMSVRENSSDIIALCMHLKNKMKQIIEKACMQCFSVC